MIDAFQEYLKRLPLNNNSIHSKFYNMPSKFELFRSLHYANGLLVLPNVWNAKSALVFEKKNFPAIATSSAAVANSLGYEDGEAMPLYDYLFVVKRILSAIKIPLSVDMEMGYGVTDEEICTNVLRLAALGVAGINIEDSFIDNGTRLLKDPSIFSNTIEAIKDKLLSEQLNIFINVRCDTYILDVKNKQQETNHRLKLYEAAGADGIFLPCISMPGDITEAVNSTKLPLNVMCIPDLPGFDNLQELGVKRVSMGPFLFNATYDHAGKLAEAVMKENNFSPVFS